MPARDAPALDTAMQHSQASRTARPAVLLTISKANTP